MAYDSSPAPIAPALVLAALGVEEMSEKDKALAYLADILIEAYLAQRTKKLNE